MVRMKFRFWLCCSTHHGLSNDVLFCTPDLVKKKPWVHRIQVLRTETDGHTDADLEFSH